ncbi:MAG TPA: glycosyltransferase, partial [Nannocystaceae bacterium]|nr:glycosyltransferase [Nannocystaceae bacterium]
MKDGEAHLAACLDSILAQTFDAWQLRLVDDGSTDRSLAIARAYAARDARIHVVAQPALGRRAALTTAHADVPTELVAWVDADDRLLPDALAKTVAVLDDVPACGLVYTEHRRIDGDGQPIASRPRPTYGPLRMLVDFATFHFRLFRSATITAAGGIHPTRELAIDYDLCLRVAEITRVVHLAEPLYEYRVHRGQLSVTRNAEQRQAAAEAVRDALHRRGFATRFEIAVGQRRFRLRRIAGARLRSWDHVRLAVATFVARARARPDTTARDVAIWPAPPRDALTRGLAAGLAELGIGPVPLGRDLARLLRNVWSGAAPDLLVLHRLARVLEAPGAGERAANLRMLGATLERARAQ